MQSISAWTFGFPFFRKKKSGYVRTCLLTLPSPSASAMQRHSGLELATVDGVASFSLSLSLVFFSPDEDLIKRISVGVNARAGYSFLEKKNQSINRLPPACTHARTYVGWPKPKCMRARIMTTRKEK
jgi:hypothetical protein